MEIKNSDELLDVSEKGADLYHLFQSVDTFAEKMKMKLADKCLDGYKGWDEEENLHGIRESLSRHLEKGDMVDVANFSMFLWYLDMKVTPPQKTDEEV